MYVCVCVSFALSTTAISHCVCVCSACVCARSRCNWNRIVRQQPSSTYVYTRISWTFRIPVVLCRFVACIKETQSLQCLCFGLDSTANIYECVCIRVVRVLLAFIRNINLCLYNCSYTYTQDVYIHRSSFIGEYHQYWCTHHSEPFQCSFIAATMESCVRSSYAYRYVGLVVWVVIVTSSCVQRQWNEEKNTRQRRRTSLNGTAIAKRIRSHSEYIRAQIDSETRTHTTHMKTGTHTVDERASRCHGVTETDNMPQY